VSGKARFKSVTALGETNGKGLSDRGSIPLASTNQIHNRIKGEDHSDVIFFYVCEACCRADGLKENLPPS